MGWKTSKLSELCSIQTGRKDVNSGSASGKYPFFTCAKEHTFSDEYSFDCEALLIAGNGVVGNTSYYNGKFEAYQRTYVLSDFVNVLPRFLFLLLDGVLKDSLVDKKLGNTMPYIKVGMLKDFIVPLPPITEQQRIVAILDQAFADIEKARANAEKNLKNARELFDSYLNQVFSQRGEGWVDTDIESLVEIGVLDKPLDGNHGEIHPKKADFVESGVPFIMASDIKDGRVDTEHCNFISMRQADTLRKGFSKDGDVLLSHKATIGRAGILSTELDYVILTPQVTYYRVMDEMSLSNEYLYWYFNNPIFLNEMNEYAGVGSTRAYIGITKQLKLKFSYPEITVQNNIVSKLNFMSKEIFRLEPIYTKKLNSLDELKQSLLQKAFSGELTKTEGYAA